MMKTEMNYILLRTAGLVLIVLGSLSVKAQTEMNYSQLICQPGLVNPAWQGRNMDVVADVLGGKRWSGVSDAPKTMGFNVHGGLKRFGVAAGVVGHFEKYVVSDRSLLGLDISSSVQLQEEAHLMFGIRVGVDMLSYDRSKIIGVEGDEFYAENKNWFATGLGLAFQWRHLLAGVSALFDVRENKALYVNAEYDVAVSQNWNVKPVTMYKYHSEWESYGEFGVLGGLPEWFQVGLTYRTSESVIVLGQLNLFEYAALRYSYHVHTGDVKNLSTNTNEIGLSINISKAVRDCRKK